MAQFPRLLFFFPFLSVCLSIAENPNVWHGRNQKVSPPIQDLGGKEINCYLSTKYQTTLCLLFEPRGRWKFLRDKCWGGARSKNLETPGNFFFVFLFSCRVCGIGVSGELLLLTSIWLHHQSHDKEGQTYLPLKQWCIALANFHDSFGQRPFMIMT